MFLLNVTLNSGKTIQQFPKNRDENAISKWVPLFNEILDNGIIPVPDHPDFLVNGGSQNSDMFLTIWAGPWVSREPIVTIGVGVKSKSAKSNWNALHAAQDLPLVTDPSKSPRTPWVASRIHSGLANHSHAATWTGETTATVGWAWLEFVEIRKKNNKNSFN